MADEQDEALRQARRIIRGMRNRGYTYRRIAAEMGVHQSTIERWLGKRKRTRPAPTGQPRKRAAITPRRRLFAQGLVEGKTPTQAALDAGAPNVNAAQKFAHMAKRSPEFRDYFNRILEKAGLDEESLAMKLKESLSATKIAGVAVDKKAGKITDVLEVPDYQVQLQAVRTGFELHKRLGQRVDENGPQYAPVHLHLTVEEQKAYEALIGGPLDFDVITIEPGPPSGPSAPPSGDVAAETGGDHPQR